jgi:adenylate kinase
MTARARLIILGRQGAGKGTQCTRLARRLGVPHLSTGDLFRAEVAAATPLGEKAETYLQHLIGRQTGDSVQFPYSQS